MEEIFLVAFHTEDGGVDDLDVRAVEFGYAVFYALDRGPAGGGVADDASFADVPAAGLELRLD